MPMQAVVSCCQQLMRSPILQKIEKNRLNSQAFTEQLLGMVYQCKTVIYKLNDMQDFHNLEQGQFRRKNIGFNLQTIISEIKSISEYHARMKNLSVEFSSNFD